MRRTTKQVKVGNITIGSQHPVVVQSMLSRPAADVQANVEQACQLAHAGCGLIRVSVPTREDVRLITALKKAISIPVVADIHFDYRIALACLDAGVDKIRINPGNIGDEKRIKAVADGCNAAGVPIRIGVNGGSLEKRQLQKYGGPTAEALVESALYNAALLEQFGFTNMIISIKSSHVPTNVAAYRLLAGQCDYPLHLGVTEAGTFRSGLVKNALGIGSLLMDGIGDTLRVSLTADSEQEILAGYDILRASGHEVASPEVISCPTCGRTNIPVEEIATEVQRRLTGSRKQLKVAVMGCVVNGIGEGREADIGIAGGVDSAVLFIHGKKVKTVYGDYIDELVKEIEKF